MINHTAPKPLSDIVYISMKKHTLHDKKRQLTECIKKYTVYKKAYSMTYKEIEKYQGYIRYLSKLKASRHIESDDLIQAAYERLIKIKTSKKYIMKIIRNAILREIKKQLPNPYRHNYQKKYPLIPEHSEFDEHQTPPEGTQDNHTEKIYFKEKLREILLRCNRREKQYIHLFLQDLSPSEIAKRMKINHRNIVRIIKKIKNKMRRITQTR